MGGPRHLGYGAAVAGLSWRGWKYPPTPSSSIQSKNFPLTRTVEGRFGSGRLTKGTTFPHGRVTVGVDDVEVGAAVAVVAEGFGSSPR